MAGKIPVIGDGNGGVSKAQATRVVAFLVSVAALAATLGWDVEWLGKLKDHPAELIIVVGGVITAVQSAIGYFDRLRRREEVSSAVKKQDEERQEALKTRLTDLISRK
jgi:hypothetical protein